ncbi:exodeoxyribonuclease VII large subunit [Clostridia bacterium]|nr:exodeoxyribonuclease VII large subunit [Clostridia bacterium]
MNIEVINPVTVTVSQVNKRIALMVKGDKALCNIAVKGEISGFTNHYKSGHFYFTLRDEDSALKCVMFRNYADVQRTSGNIPADGDAVTVRGSLGVFERDGVYQLYAEEISLSGAGELYAAFVALKDKLEAEGIFSRSRPLPPYPKHIALITSKTGAVLHDMITVFERRCPWLELMLFPVTVQGEASARTITEAVAAADSFFGRTDAPELIIIARGGGSAEDLAAFNDEHLARAIFSSRIPTISAVGHETDFTIADFAADMRAPTPTAAAEFAAPDIYAAEEYLTELQTKLRDKMQRKTALLSEKLSRNADLISIFSPKKKLVFSEQKLSGLSERLMTQISGKVTAKADRLSSVSEIIHSLSPLRVLSRGYAVLTDSSGEVVRTSAAVTSGDLLEIRMSSGRISVRVAEIIE